LTGRGPPASIAAVADDALSRLPDDPSLTVQIAIGIEHFEDGLVTLTVHGDGRATVVVRSAGEERRYERRLEPDELRRLGEELADLGLTSLRARPGGRPPDDAPVEVLVARDGRPLHSAELWYGDRWEDPQLDRLVRRFDALVDSVSEGAV
jgi:hypothetical protein